MGSISKQAWIKIYKDLQRAATQFPQYYYREFFKRRIRDHFTAVDSKLSDTERYKKAENSLRVLRRQAALSQSYPSPKLVIENKRSKGLHLN